MIWHTYTILICNNTTVTSVLVLQYMLNADIKSNFYLT